MSPEFWPESVTGESFEFLSQFAGKYDILLIGGWAARRKRSRGGRRKSTTSKQAKESGRNPTVNRNIGLLVQAGHLIQLPSTEFYTNPIR